ncbi:hypothetical protein AMS68_007347 [Peltaster fructicola]|uniref:Uncharacterized protein n=1 Tax=Peltaster fructicola TaxID=286661 RepID=A0A6H0Y5E9_9PEZI|nr:hypothetical protein AMS68_007347 [Peltaster fructicola]
MSTAAIYTGASNNAQSTTTSTFEGVYHRLIKDRPFPVLPNASPYPHDRSASHEIAELHVHPVLEALLHILNNDLPGAHFLCRHVETGLSEAMYTHGILHRIEGDYRNAEAWYGDVAESDCFKQVWPGGLDAATGFIREIEKLRKQKVGDLSKLQAESKREIEVMLTWCQTKFGTDKVADATKIWVPKPEKTKEMADKMLVGGEGWRQF